MRLFPTLILTSQAVIGFVEGSSSFVKTPQHKLSNVVDGNIHDLVNASPLLSLHRDLVEIESTTGSEYHAGRFLVEYLTRHNFTVETQLVTKAGSHAITAQGSRVSKHDRFNVLAYPGRNRTTRALVTSHYDTVPPYWSYEVKGRDEIWGRGSVDAKGAVAAQIQAVEQLLCSKAIFEGDVALLFVVGEETEGDGMATANKLGLSWETVIFGEPTELKLASGHKGLVRLTVSATGRAGHSGYPELSVNANSMLLPALMALDQLDLPRSDNYGNSTLNIGRMEGGVAANVIPGYAEAEVAVRIAAGEVAEIEKSMLDAINAGGHELEVKFASNKYGPVHVDSDVKGFDTIVVSYGTDVPLLRGEHKRYLYGPGSIFVAHSDNEHLTVGDLEGAVKGYKTLIRAALDAR
ncbi:MAG: hypothetical protein M1819_002229 [Sarea resinae]|nr:MAG: hypothetical protein M1819_002229 [Sarea resinae]